MSAKDKSGPGVKRAAAAPKVEGKKAAVNRKSHVRDLGSEIVQKTVLWMQSISDRTAYRIDAAVSQDGMVIDAGLQSATLLEKVLALEIKRWKIVVQLTDKIVTALSADEVLLLAQGWNEDDSNKKKYQFRRLRMKHGISTRYLGVANSTRKRTTYYAYKKASASGRKGWAYMLNELASKLAGEYTLRAGADVLAQRLVADIARDVGEIIETRIGGK